MAGFAGKKLNFPLCFKSRVVIKVATEAMRNIFIYHLPDIIYFDNPNGVVINLFANVGSPESDRKINGKPNGFLAFYRIGEFNQNRNTIVPICIPPIGLRGGADDGYAVYAAVSAIEALKAQGIAHPRIVGLIESCEESGSFDLPFYLDQLKGRLGDVSLVVCLDSGAGNYDQLWLTTSLRGMASGTLKVEILTEGIHSGDASGLVPSSFRIMRQVLDRLETETTSHAQLDELPLFAATAPAVLAAKRDSEVEGLLGDLDIDGMSPREAMDALYRLKGLLTSGKP